MNSITLYGRLGRDAELHNTRGGKQVAKFMLASNGFLKSDPPVWLKVEVWGRPAEWVGEYRKGQEVMVFGMLKDASYEKQDGTKVKEFVVNANRVETVGVKKHLENPAPAPAAQQEMYDDSGTPSDTPDDDIPF